MEGKQRSEAYHAACPFVTTHAPPRSPALSAAGRPTPRRVLPPAGHKKTRDRQVTRRPQRHEDGRTTPAARRSGKSKCVKEECEKKKFKSIYIRNIRNIHDLYWVKCVHGKVHVIAFICTHISPQHYIFVKTTLDTPGSPIESQQCPGKNPGQPDGHEANWLYMHAYVI